jgi:hypothetical protein
MMTNRICGIFVAVVLSVSLFSFVVVLRGLRRLSTQSFQPTPQLQAIEMEFQVIKTLASSGAFRERKFDHSSVGSIAIESEVVDLRRDISAFEALHGRLPVNFRELSSVRFPPNSDERVSQYAKECRIVGLTVDSCILNCDSWTPPNNEALNRLVRSFDSQTERFYKVQGHVLLYVPPPTAAKPSSNDKN